MHIADGVVPVEYCLLGYAASVGGLYWFGRDASSREISRMGLLAAATFTASFVQFPVAGASIHLGLFGLLGVLLRGRAFPAVFAALLLQTLLLSHGGLLSLGLNGLNMGGGALAGWAVWSLQAAPAPARAFAAGFVGSLLPASLMATEFWLSGYGKGFFVITGVYALVAAIEGVATAAIVGYLRRAKPEVFATA